MSYVNSREYRHTEYNITNNSPNVFIKNMIMNDADASSIAHKLSFYRGSNVITFDNVEVSAGYGAQFFVMGLESMNNTIEELHLINCYNITIAIINNLSRLRQIKIIYIYHDEDIGDISPALGHALDLNPNLKELTITAPLQNQDLILITYGLERNNNLKYLFLFDTQNTNNNDILPDLARHLNLNQGLHKFQMASISNLDYFETLLQSFQKIPRYGNIFQRVTQEQRQRRNRRPERDIRDRVTTTQVLHRHYSDVRHRHSSDTRQSERLPSGTIIMDEMNQIQEEFELPEPFPEQTQQLQGMVGDLGVPDNILFTQEQIQRQTNAIPLTPFQRQLAQQALQNSNMPLESDLQRQLAQDINLHPETTHASLMAREEAQNILEKISILSKAILNCIDKDEIFTELGLLQNKMEKMKRTLWECRKNDEDIITASTYQELKNYDQDLVVAKDGMIHLKSTLERLRLRPDQENIKRYKSPFDNQILFENELIPL